MCFTQVTYTELKLRCYFWCQYLRLWFRKLGSCVCSDMDDPAMDYSSQSGSVLHAQSTVSHTPMNLWDEHDIISWRRSWSHAFPLLRYSVVKRADNEQLLLVATERMNNLASILGTNLESLATFAGRSTAFGQNDAFWTGLSIYPPLFHSSPGSDLEGGVCQHPTIPSKEVPLLPANHVTMTKGTGLVHTAPAHGMEDYSVATHFNLPVVRHPHLYSICWNIVRILGCCWF